MNPNGCPIDVTSDELVLFIRNEILSHYVIMNVPVRDSVNVTNNVTFFGKCCVISNVPERINLGILK